MKRCFVGGFIHCILTDLFVIVGPSETGLLAAARLEPFTES